MSRDRDKPDAPGPIPPELAPYLRKRAWPRTQKLGEDPALDAAAEAYTARDSELGIREERPAQDLSIGMGNASAYVAPAEVPAAMVPSSASEGAPKVEVAMADIPRALPSGSRTAQTVEVKVMRPPPGGVGDAAGRGPTIMGTARLPALKEASPWATDAAPVTPPIAPVELPSAHAPAAAREPGAERAETRGRAKGILLTGAVLVVAVLIVLRVAGTHHNDGGIAATTASATTIAPPSPSAEPSASAAPSPPVTTGEPAIETSAAPTTAPPRAPAARKPRNALDDPYDAAVAPLPPETAAPAPPPAPPPPAATPAKPTAPPPDDDEIYHRPKRKSP